MRPIGILAVLGVALCSTAAMAFPRGGSALSYQGPCDVIAGGCAEGYSVTHAVTASYGGPLFQLYNGTTTLDIKQTWKHHVDMSTWSAFCGGVAANCVYGKIYAQIQGHANDLVPSVFSAPVGPNCSTGSGYQCAAPFAIDSGTGLPILSTVAPQEYSIASDANATGLNGGTTAMSVVLSAKPITATMCCGVFGRTHKYNAGDVAGTDFHLAMAYGQFSSGGAVCATTTTYCVAADMEGLVGAQGDYSSTLLPNTISEVAYQPTNGSVAGWVNNHAIFNAVVSGGSENAGLCIHLGGGGDLSQPAPVNARDMLITNTTMTASDAGAVYLNLTQFYAGQLFP